MNKKENKKEKKETFTMLVLKKIAASILVIIITLITLFFLNGCSNTSNSSSPEPYIGETEKIYFIATSAINFPQAGGETLVNSQYPGELALINSVQEANDSCARYPGARVATNSPATDIIIYQNAPYNPSILYYTVNRTIIIDPVTGKEVETESLWTIPSSSIGVDGYVICEISIPKRNPILQ